MNAEDKKILDSIEDQMKVKELLDTVEKKNYTSILIVGMSEDTVDVMHYTDYGGMLALGMCDMAKRSIIDRMRENDSE